MVMPVTEKEIRFILFKHPWLPYEYAKRMAEDHERKNCSKPEAIRIYDRELQRLRRAEAKGEVTDVAGVIAGKYLDGRGSYSRQKKAEPTKRKIPEETEKTIISARERHKGKMDRAENKARARAGKARSRKKGHEAVSDQKSHEYH